MLNEPHYPSKWSVAIVFGFLFLIIGGIFFWAFYLNFGSVLFRSDQNFTTTANGETRSCLSSCEISLPPGTYDFLVRSEGFYEQIFTLQVTRWGTQEISLVFELIPYLKTSSTVEIPSEDLRSAIRNESGQQVLYVFSDDGEKRITEFESLVDPLLQVSDENAVVVDSGRAFFVDLDTGRRIRRFDDSVFVKNALLSDGGKRVLFFVELEGSDFIWVWDHETNLLNPLSWHEPMERVQWDSKGDYRIFVLTDQLVDKKNASLFDSLLNTTDAPSIPVGLFRYNLDSGEVRELAVFDDEVPNKLLSRQDRYFVEYEGGSFDELVVR